jgi:membrane protein
MGHPLIMSHATDRRNADPESDAKPESPTKLTKHSWSYVARKTAREFSKDECTDLAAALTYYAVLALFPAMIALLSMVGLFGQGKATVDTLLGILKQVGAGSLVGTIEGPLTTMAAQPQAAGFAFVIGLATALWSASGYVGSFGRAMNRIYEIREGRPFWKLRPLQILVTLVMILMLAAVALALVLTGPVVDAVAEPLGIGSTATTVWDIAKWPVLVVAVVCMFVLLFYAAPNARVGGVKRVLPGVVVGLAVWVAASAAFALYVANFGSYDKTYGALGGVVVLLVWFWLTNVALLLGLELNAELERNRELRAGVPRAHKELQLDARSEPQREKTT